MNINIEILNKTLVNQVMYNLFYKCEVDLLFENKLL